MRETLGRVPSESASLLMATARGYGIPLVDYEREGDGVLISVGSGLMMATMDAIPRLRWCVDIGGGRIPPRLADWLVFVDRLVPLVVVTAWFTVTDPAPVRSALQVLRRPLVVVKSNVDVGLGQRFDDIGAISEYLKDLELDQDVARSLANE